MKIKLSVEKIISKIISFYEGASGWWIFKWHFKDYLDREFSKDLKKFLFFKTIIKYRRILQAIGSGKTIVDFLGKRLLILSLNPVKKHGCFLSRTKKLKKDIFHRHPCQK